MAAAVPTRNEHQTVSSSKHPSTYDVDIHQDGKRGKMATLRKPIAPDHDLLDSWVRMCVLGGSTGHRDRFGKSTR